MLMDLSGSFPIFKFTFKLSGNIVIILAAFSLSPEKMILLQWKWLDISPTLLYIR